MADASRKECHRCGRVFARTEHLQRHERSHTKEKPFGCPLCSKAFTRKDLLKRHNRIVHDPGVDGKDHLQVIDTNTAQSSNPATLPLNLSHATSHSVTSQENHGNAFILPPVGSTALATQSMPIVEFGAVRTDQTLDDAALWTAGPGYTDFTASYIGDDFSNFIDSIGFPSNPFSPSFQPVPDWPSDPPFVSYTGAIEPQPTHENATNAPAEDLDAVDTPWASRMPSEQREDPQEVRKRAGRRSMAQVSPQCRAIVVEKLKAYASVVSEDFVLPSRHTLTCFVTGYASIFNEHYPLLHLPTLKLESLSLDLFLAIASLGAQYYWEPAKGLELFHVARVIVYERLRGQASQGDREKLSSNDTLHAAQALLLLIAVSTWSEAGKSEAFSLRGLLEALLHADALKVKQPNQEASWLDWKYYEEVKRTKLVAYCFFNLQTITFDVPPMLLYRDIDVSLACSESLWRADSEGEWRELMAMERSDTSFINAFHSLFDTPGVKVKTPTLHSPLSGHSLLQAIIQHIWLLQQAGNLPVQQSLASTEAATSVGLALKRWRARWEPDLEPYEGVSNSDGPMPFTSRALLRLAYIRINIDSGSSRSIGSWDPDVIAVSLRRQAPIQRSYNITRAALHCAQGLGIPIKLGINFVAHTQVFFWSNQYALCSLECALLLTKWLEAVAIPHPVPSLTDQEKRLLDFVVQLVNHTEYEAPRETLLRNNKYLSIVVLRTWAKLFRPDAVWDIVDLIGKSLEAYADLLQHDMDQETRVSTYS